MCEVHGTQIVPFTLHPAQIARFALRCVDSQSLFTGLRR
mgnify:CR=1 FL=1